MDFNPGILGELRNVRHWITLTFICTCSVREDSHFLCVFTLFVFYCLHLVGVLYNERKSQGWDHQPLDLERSVDFQYAFKMKAFLNAEES